MGRTDLPAQGLVVGGLILGKPHAFTEKRTKSLTSSFLNSVGWLEGFEPSAFRATT